MGLLKCSDLELAGNFSRLAGCDDHEEVFSWLDNPATEIDLFPINFDLNTFRKISALDQNSGVTAAEINSN